MTNKDTSTAQSAAKTPQMRVSCHFRQVVAVDPHGKGGDGSIC